MIDLLIFIKFAFIKKIDDSLVDDESTNIRIYDVQRTKNLCDNRKLPTSRYRIRVVTQVFL